MTDSTRPPTRPPTPPSDPRPALKKRERRKGAVPAPASGNKEKLDATVHLRLAVNERQAMQQAATDDGRSLSAWIRRACQHVLRALATGGHPFDRE